VGNEETLDGRVAVVTGSSRGAGQAIATAFAKAGAKVVLNGRSEEKGRQAIEELDVGDRAIFVAADVTSKEGCEALIAAAHEKWDHVDILVNNAGGAIKPAPIAEMEDETLEVALRWNLWSTFWLTRLVLADMIPRRFGRIINISSLEGKGGRPVNSSYVASKHALHGFTKSCAVENGEFGITVNALCPGMMVTDIVHEVGTKIAAEQGMSLDEFLDLRTAQAATGKTTELADVGAVALLLASDAGSGITGGLISIDGGTAPY
jgi:3-hydroxybutyrate dehydrogenase